MRLLLAVLLSSPAAAQASLVPLVGPDAQTPTRATSLDATGARVGGLETWPAVPQGQVWVVGHRRHALAFENPPHQGEAAFVALLSGDGSTFFDLQFGTVGSLAYMGRLGGGHATASVGPYTWPVACNHDGTRALLAGEDDYGLRVSAVWHTDQGFTIELHDVDGSSSHPFVVASGLSADGQTAVGSTDNPLSSLAFEALRWDASGQATALGSLDPADLGSRAHDVSADGAVIVGKAVRPDWSERAVRWTAAGGPVELLPLLAGTDSEALQVSDDGQIIYGTSADQAVHWIGDAPPVPVLQALQERGLGCLEGWSDLEWRDLSGDGNALCGVGTNQGTTRAFVAYLEAPELPLGTRTCHGTSTNSTGQRGRLTVLGSACLAEDRLALTAEQLPAGQPGFFLLGSQGAQLPNALGEGLLCLGGQVLRAADEPFQSDAAGAARLDLDLAALPLLAGTTWRAQAWYRDGATSHTTDAVRLELR